MSENTDVKTADEIYKAGAKSLEDALAAADTARNDGKAMGILKVLEYQNAHNEMLKFAVLYQVKADKEYRKNGMTWADFCGAIGENYRTVDRTLSDMSPFYDRFSDKMTDLLGLPFNKIRYLGRAISDKMTDFDGEAIIVDDRKIPLKPENKDEIETLLNEIKESHKRELKAKDDALEAERKLADTYRKKAEKQDKEISERNKAQKPEAREYDREEELLEKLNTLKTTFDTMILPADPERIEADCTTKTKAEIIATLMYMKSTITAYYDTAMSLFGYAASEDEGWTPPADTNIAEME